MPTLEDTPVFQFSQYVFNKLRTKLLFETIFKKGVEITDIPAIILKVDGQHLSPILELNKLLTQVKDGFFAVLPTDKDERKHITRPPHIPRELSDFQSLIPKALKTFDETINHLPVNLGYTMENLTDLEKCLFEVKSKYVALYTGPCCKFSPSPFIDNDGNHLSPVFSLDDDGNVHVDSENSVYKEIVEYNMKVKDENVFKEHGVTSWTFSKEMLLENISLMKQCLASEEPMEKQRGSIKNALDETLEKVREEYQTIWASVLSAPRGWGVWNFHACHVNAILSALNYIPENRKVIQASGRFIEENKNFFFSRYYRNRARENNLPLVNGRHDIDTYIGQLVKALNSTEFQKNLNKHKRALFENGFNMDSADITLQSQFEIGGATIQFNLGGNNSHLTLEGSTDDPAKNVVEAGQYVRLHQTKKITIRASGWNTLFALENIANNKVDPEEFALLFSKSINDRLEALRQVYQEKIKDTKPLKTTIKEFNALLREIVLFVKENEKQLCILPHSTTILQKGELKISFNRLGEVILGCNKTHERFRFPTSINIQTVYRSSLVADFLKTCTPEDLCQIKDKVQQLATSIPQLEETAIDNMKDHFPVEAMDYYLEQSRGPSC